MDCSLFGRPCIGEPVSGDTAIICKSEDELFLAIVDVLGHGREAHVVARRSEDFLRENWDSDIAITLTALHAELKGSRGAAVGLAHLDVNTRKLAYIGVGNTVVRIFGNQPMRLFSHDGIVGVNFHVPTVQSLQLSESDVAIFHTDGIRESFTMQEYPQIMDHSAPSIARSVVQRFGKTYDDATCIALRYKQ